MYAHAVNKISKKLLRRNGQPFLPESPLNLGISVTLSGCRSVLQEFSADVTWSFDGASDNTGGDGDAFCGDSSPFYRMFISRDIWKHVDDKLDKAGVGKHLQQFFSGRDLAGLTKSCKETLREERAAKERTDRMVDAGADAPAGQGQTVDLWMQQSRVLRRALQLTHSARMTLTMSAMMIRRARRARIPKRARIPNMRFPKAMTVMIRTNSPSFKLMLQGPGIQFPTDLTLANA